MDFDEITSLPCRVCGTQIPAGNRFCGSCGSAVSAPVQDAALQPYTDRRFAFRTRQRRPATAKWVAFGAFFLFAFLFFLGGCIPVFTNIPGFQARLTGVETTALATAVSDCDDDGSYYMYTFTDRHGQVYQITDNSTCSSGIVSDGEHLTLWYNPDKPTQFITVNDLKFDLSFSIGFSIPLVIWLVVVVIALIRGIVARLRPARVAWPGV